MSLSVFYAVRFSPAPELGEWLNVAVVGEGITEHKAGMVVADSKQRIEAAFGHEAMERVESICKDLGELVAAMAIAHEKGEETQPIPMAMRDQALSVSFSDKIMVFEGSFEEALAGVAQQYLTAEEDLAEAPQGAQAVETEHGSELLQNATRVLKKLKEAVGEILPTTEPGPVEHSQQAAMVVVIGGAGPVGSALLPRLAERGVNVRIYDPSGQSQTSAAPERKISLFDVARHAGVAAITASHVLLGEAGKPGISPGTAERIRDAATVLGFRPSDHASVQTVGGDVAASLDGADAVIYIAEVGAGQADAHAGCRSLAEQARAKGITRFILASTAHGAGGAKNRRTVEESLNDLGSSQFSITIVAFADLPEGEAVDDGVSRILAALEGPGAGQKTDVDWNRLATEHVAEGSQAPPTERTIHKRS